jgi:hypothetical protein
VLAEPFGGCRNGREVWTELRTNLRIVSLYLNPSPPPLQLGFGGGPEPDLPALHVLRSGSLARVSGVRICNGGGGGTAAALAGDAGWSERVGLGVKVKVKVNGNVNDG